jgi:hypothetical protein
MEKRNIKDSHHAIITQLYKNTSSWIGHYDLYPQETEAGQVFECPADGELDAIEVYSEAVCRPGTLCLTLHQFDEKEGTWGPEIAHSEIDVRYGDEAKWLSFPVQPVHLQRKGSYGFKIGSHDAFIAVGEAAWTSAKPLVWGKEWTAGTHNLKGRYYRYFSLAFKVDVRA